MIWIELRAQIDLLLWLIKKIKSKNIKGIYYIPQIYHKNLKKIYLFFNI